MTQEEKARAYDEAKERMKAFLKEWENCGAYGEAMEKARSVFPELCESDDERIRKWLYDFIYNCPNETFEFYGGVGKQAVLAYLEKQKESLKDFIDDFPYGCEQKEQKPVDYEAELKKCKDNPLYFYDKYVSIKQKPAEWDEYTKTNLDRALQIIKKAKGTLQGYQSDDGIYECDKAIECLEHFLYRGLEIEKPTEWSEEDERKYQCIRCILLTDMGKKVGSWKYSEILEWYEKRGIGRYTNFKPHWKPSEEQMVALDGCLEHWSGNKFQKEILESLYEQLKKLM